MSINKCSEQVRSFAHQSAFGTGHSIFQNLILPSIEQAEHEVIFVTCFWARSPTLDSLNESLLRLSAKAGASSTKIHVRICFSSSSLFQNLFHTSSLSGGIWAPARCQRSLGLPSLDRLSGLDLEVKSIFVLPFSVMHPKFVILDRNRVLLPSCNVSWEEWFEGCLDIGGEIVQNFVSFWVYFWASEEDKSRVIRRTNYERGAPGVATNSPKLLAQRWISSQYPIPSNFLPSAHHRNPQFTLPWQKYLSPPSTPRNLFLLSAFQSCKKDLYIQTPNLTAPPVLSALLAALRRGISITIITSKRLMILEQLVTAGTTTSRCIKKLIRRHKSLMNTHQAQNPQQLESGSLLRPGMLRISFFEPRQDASTSSAEPVQSHVKLTIIDGECVVLGSGNMDRASWYTSQELDVAFVSVELAQIVRAQVDEVMRPRSKCVYDSAGLQYVNI